MTNLAAERSAYVVAGLVGAATWLVVSTVGGRREAWDSDLYFSVALPAIGLVVALLGFLIPQRPWRWAFVPFGGQALVALVQNPTGGLLPLGLIVFGFFGVACLVPAYVGAKLATATGRR
jgi:hypothetical protein